MLSLLRNVFWIAVALALLPSVVPKQASTVPMDTGAADAMAAASATFADLRGLCERRPEACAAGAQFATAFWQRARAGATIIYEFASDRLGQPERTAAGSSASTPNAGTDERGNEVARTSQHTLTTSDLAPPWRGPPLRKEVSARRSS